VDNETFQDKLWHYSTVTLCSLGKITICEIKKGIVVFMLVLEVKKGIVVFKRKATPKVSFPFIY
jgi:hypothetical protein